MEFSVLAETFDKIEAISGRLEMTAILAELFKKTSPCIADKVTYLCQGALAPAYSGIDLGLGEKLVMESLALATGHSREEIERSYKKQGDLGLVSEEYAKKKRQHTLFSQALTVEKVHSSLMRLALLEGHGSQEEKIKSLAELLGNASPLEARYLVRFPLGKLRLGIGDPTILDALSVLKAEDKSLRPELERAYNLSSDLGLVAKEFLENPNAIRRFRIKPFHPIRPALAERLASAEEIIEKLGKCAVEAKYDGFRMQIHKQGDKVEIFSRKLEKMAQMFPEIVSAAEALPQKEIIFEGEALAYNEKEKRFYSFQQTIQRKRKYGVEKMAEDFPLKLFVFDLLDLEGEDYTQVPYEKRRKTLEKIFANRKSLLQPSHQIITDQADELEKYFQDCLKKGLEGIIAKDLSQPYVAGARQFAWIKLKKSYGALADTVDAVVVGYYLGKGQRAEFKFGGLLVAVLNDDTNKFETIARIGSGFSEEEMQLLQEKLKQITAAEKPARLISKLEPDFWTKLKYVVTVSSDEISLSPMHTCGLEGDKGFALRFPRMLELREDKSVDDATTTKEIIHLYELQHRKRK